MNFKIFPSTFFESFSYALISIIGSFITIIFNCIYIAFKHQRYPNSEEMFGVGESIIICIPLLITIIYSLYQEKSKKGFNGFSGFVFYISLFLTAICATIYTFFKKDDIAFNNVVLSFSVFIIVWTFISLITSHHASSFSVDTAKERKDDLTVLEDKVKNLKQ